MQPPPTAGKLDIWIIDDDSEIRDMISTLLSQTDDLICDQQLKSCEDALKILRNDHAPVGILMDIAIPGGISGIEGVKRVKAISPATDVIMLTGSDKDDQIVDAFCAGASGFLTKSSTGNEIIEAIRYTLRGGRPMTPHIAKKVMEKFVELAKPTEEAYGLTARESEILKLMRTGLSKKQIAEKLFLSTFTVETHTKNIYAKLHVHSIAELMGKLYSR